MEVQQTVSTQFLFCREDTRQFGQRTKKKIPVLVGLRGSNHIFSELTEHSKEQNIEDI